MLRKLGIALIAFLIAAVLFVIIARRRSSTVYVERTFNAPVDRVWKVMSDPEMMKQWWGPKDFTAPIVQNDLRVNGTFLLSMKSPNGDMHFNSGRYLEIVPNERIVSMIAFSDEKGTPVPGNQVPVPGVWPDEIKVTTEFVPVEGKTTVKVKQEGVPLLMKLFSKLGWQQQFDKLEKLL